MTAITASQVFLSPRILAMAVTDAISAKMRSGRLVQSTMPGFLMTSSGS